ncbi:MAG: DUF2971 domain-containing protein [Bacteroidetes bacterium]|nr:DUF2971 domain-containing protein [Bacteroidota bacterium]
MISKQEIYFPRPSDFNDPFDGNIPIRWDLMTYKDCFKKNLDIINIKHKDKDQKSVREYAKKVTDEKTLWHPDKLKRERPEQLEKWNSIIGLLSLSSIPDNILMWSHYSFNHTGFVVGLDSKSLMEKYDFDYFESIVYQEYYPLITGDDDGTTQFYKKFFHKSELWKYENEWRISKNHMDKRVVKLEKDTIKEIIIGCRTTTKETNNIIKLTRKNLGFDVQIMKASQNKDNFKITIDTIE